MTMTEFTADYLIPIPQGFPAEMLSTFTSGPLRDLRTRWRDLGCTSKVRRTDAGLTVDVTGPVNAVLDVMAEVCACGVAIQMASSHARKWDAVIASAVDDFMRTKKPGTIVFLCDFGHVKSVEDSPTLRDLMESRVLPRCEKCSSKMVEATPEILMRFAIERR